MRPSTACDTVMMGWVFVSLNRSVGRLVDRYDPGCLGSRLPSKTQHAPSLPARPAARRTPVASASRQSGPAWPRRPPAPPTPPRPRPRPPSSPRAAAPAGAARLPPRAGPSRPWAVVWRALLRRRRAAGACWKGEIGFGRQPSQVEGRVGSEAVHMRETHLLAISPSDANAGAGAVQTLLP